MTFFYFSHIIGFDYYKQKIPLYPLGGYLTPLPQAILPLISAYAVP